MPFYGRAKIEDYRFLFFLVEEGSSVKRHMDQAVPFKQKMTTHPYTPHAHIGSAIPRNPMRETDQPLKGMVQNPNFMVQHMISDF